MKQLFTKYKQAVNNFSHQRLTKFDEKVHMQNRAIEVPTKWTMPRFSYGQPVKLLSGGFGRIIGLEYATPGSQLAYYVAPGWHYTIEVDRFSPGWHLEEMERAAEAELQLLEEA